VTIDEGRKGGARAAWDALRSHDPAAARDSKQALEATRLAFRLGDRRLVDAWLTRALTLASAEGPGEAAKVHLGAANLDRSAGRFAGCLRHLERALSLAPDAVEIRERAADLLQAFGARGQALVILEEGASVKTGLAGTHRLWLRIADLALAEGLPEVARRAASRAVEADPETPMLRVLSGDVLRDAGDFEDAARRYEEALEKAPSLAEAHVGLGYLALFRGLSAEAVFHAEQALAAAPDLPRARLLHAAARLFRGDPPAPLVAAFDAVLESTPAHPEALVLRGRAKRASGDPRGALLDLLAAKHVADEAQIWVIDLELVALGRRHYGLLDVEAVTALARSPDKPNDHAARERSIQRRIMAPALDHAVRLASRVHHVIPEAILVSLAQRLGYVLGDEEGELTAPRDLRLRLLALLSPEAILAQLGGNRTRAPSLVDPASGTLAPLSLRSSARQRAKVLQWSIRGRPAADVLGEFDAILRDHPRSHHPHAYRGELLLWLGRIDEAEEEFRRGLVIRPRARWLHIGIGSVHVLRGDSAAALASFQRSIDCAPALVGPTLYGVRGEAHRLRGDLPAAAADLTRTCRDTPSRVSAWVNLWLVEDDLGHEETRDAAWKELTRRAPWLLADAAEEALGLALPALADDHARRATLEHALRMLRGNRSSSCVTYFTREGELRTVFAAD